MQDSNPCKRRKVLKYAGGLTTSIAATGAFTGTTVAVTPEEYFSAPSTDTLEQQYSYFDGISKKGEWTNSDYTTWYDSTHFLDVGRYEAYPPQDSGNEEIVPFRISSQAYAEESEKWGDGEKSTYSSNSIAADGIGINLRDVEGASRSDIQIWIKSPSNSNYVAVQNSDGSLEDVDPNTDTAKEVLGWGVENLVSFAEGPLPITDAADLASTLGTQAITSNSGYGDWDPWPDWPGDIKLQSFVTHDDGRYNSGTSCISQYLQFGLEKPVDATVELDIFAATYQMVCPVGSGESTPGYKCSDGSGDMDTGALDTFTRIFRIEI